MRLKHRQAGKGHRNSSAASPPHPAPPIPLQDPRRAAAEEKGPFSSKGSNLGISKVDGDRQSLGPCRR